MYKESDLTTDRAYTLTVLGGTWQLVTKDTLLYKTVLENSAPNGILALTNENLKVRADIPGDVNQDGRVLLGDVLLLIQALASGDTLPNADIDGDGVLTLLDVVNALKLAVKV